MEQNTGRSRKQMLIRIACAVFAAIGICFAAGIVYISMHFAGKVPVLLNQPQEAKANVVSMMDCLCAGDFSGAKAYIYGTPELGVKEQSRDAVGILIWDAYMESLSYQLVGECYATKEGLAQKIRFTCLDVTKITAQLKDASESILEQRVQNAENISDIYNEELEYREDVVMEVLQEAASQVIGQHSQTVTVELVVTLKYQDGQWWVVADTAFVDAVFGHILF